MTVRLKQRESLGSKIIFWFAFLGPLGNLIPVPRTPWSFRFYYLLLLPAIFIYLFKGIGRRTFNHLVILTPVLLYMLVSAVIEYVNFSPAYEGSDGTSNPLVRFGLLTALLVFTVCAADQAQSLSLFQKLRVVAVFMYGYILSMLVGWIFSIGFYKRIFTVEFLSRFEVLVQVGFGLLRFSPGSYPNEYGVVSSFALSVLTLLILYRKRLEVTGSPFELFLKPPRLFTLYLLTLGALFLATTRAAYIAYLLSVVYIALTQGGIRKGVVFTAKIVLGAALLLACIEPFFDAIGILVGGYHAFFERNNFANGRLNALNIALAYFLQQPYLGAGFGAVDMMHNVYLQLVFGLGILGSVILLMTVLVLLIRARGLTFATSRPTLSSAPEMLLHHIMVVGLVHVGWFALSNHNLNHFLTWFVVLICFMNTRGTVRARTLKQQPAIEKGLPAT